MRRLHRPSSLRSQFRVVRYIFFAVLLFVIAGCHVERRKSDAELALNAQQAAGRRVYERHCERCHEAYSSRDLQGPSLTRLYRKTYLPSGAPANDDRVSEAIKYGHGKMPGFGQVLTQQQIDDLLAYLHTL